MINILNLDNEIVMQLTEADITKLLRVARAAMVVVEEDKLQFDRLICVLALEEAIKEVEHLLDE